MANQDRQAKISRFEEYNFKPRAFGREAPKFHDNDVRSVKVLPPLKGGELGAVELIFFDRDESVERTLLLKGCVNLRFSVDFDILSDNTSSPTNSAGQTSNVELRDCNDCIERLIKAGIPDWNVEY